MLPHLNKPPVQYNKRRYLKDKRGQKKSGTKSGLGIVFFMKKHRKIEKYFQIPVKRELFNIHKTLLFIQLNICFYFHQSEMIII